MTKLMNEHKLQIVDLSYLKEMADGESAIIKEMIDIFIMQVDEFVEQLRQLHADKEWQNLGKVAHKAKSSVAIMGMTDLADNLKKLELLTKNGEGIELYEQIIKKFEEQCRLAVNELKTIYDSL